MSDTEPNYDDGGIYAVTQYRDAKGHSIEEHRKVVDGVPVMFPSAKGDVLFVANVIANINTPHGPVQHPIQVPLSASSITDAFSVHAAQVEARAPRIVSKIVEDMQAQARRASLGMVRG